MQLKRLRNYRIGDKGEAEADVGLRLGNGSMPVPEVGGKRDGISIALLFWGEWETNSCRFTVSHHSPTTRQVSTFLNPTTLTSENHDLEHYGTSRRCREYPG